MPRRTPQPGRKPGRPKGTAGKPQWQDVHVLRWVYQQTRHGLSFDELVRFVATREISLGAITLNEGNPDRTTYPKRLRRLAKRYPSMAVLPLPKATKASSAKPAFSGLSIVSAEMHCLRAGPVRRCRGTDPDN